MESVVLFAVGSTLTVEYEEACARRCIRIAAWVKNRVGNVFCADPDRLIQTGDLTDELRGVPFLCPLFTPRNRAQAVREAAELGLQPAAALIDPTAVVARATPVGVGSFVNASVTIGAASNLGKYVVINRSASLGHHATIGDYASIGPGGLLCGQVTVGAGAMLGAGCVVLPGIEIGSDAIVGAGSIVTRDIKPGGHVRGNPARDVSNPPIPPADQARETQGGRRYRS